MGLDMELRAVRVLTPQEEAIVENALRGAAGAAAWPRDTEFDTEVRMPLATWRKACAIHTWICAHARRWTDRRGHDRYLIRRTDLDILHAHCRRVLADPALAAELLPSSEPVDAWYLRQLHETVRQLDAALALPPEEWEFEYVYSA